MKYEWNRTEWSVIFTVFCLCFFVCSLYYTTRTYVWNYHTGSGQEAKSIAASHRHGHLDTHDLFCDKVASLTPEIQTCGWIKAILKAIFDTTPMGIANSTFLEYESTSSPIKTINHYQIHSVTRIATKKVKSAESAKAAAVDFALLNVLFLSNYILTSMSFIVD